MRNLHEDVCSFLMKSHRILIIISSVSDRICGSSITNILYSLTSPENRAVCKVMWISVLQPKYETDDSTDVCAMHAEKLRLQALTLNE